MTPQDHEPVLDPAALDALCASLGGRSELGAVAHLYRTNATAILGALEQALEVGDAPAAQRLAHSLKSSSRYVGAVHVIHLCQVAEDAAAAGDLAAVQNQLAALRTALVRARTALDAEVHP